MAVCTHCGRESQGYERFCMSCGQPLGNSGPAAATERMGRQYGSGRRRNPDRTQQTRRSIPHRRLAMSPEPSRP